MDDMSADPDDFCYEPPLRVSAFPEDQDYADQQKESLDDEPDDFIKQEARWAQELSKE